MVVTGTVLMRFLGVKTGNVIATAREYRLVVNV